jgi:hypothetical protein
MIMSLSYVFPMTVPRPAARRALPRGIVDLSYSVCARNNAEEKRIAASVECDAASNKIVVTRTDDEQLQKLGKLANVLYE